MFIFGILFAWVIFPPILKFILRSVSNNIFPKYRMCFKSIIFRYIQQVILKPGTQMRDMYDALPFPLIFKVYIFNVLNPDEVMQGNKPRFEEIGPYVFE